MRSQKVDQGTARAIHRSMILNELRRNGPLSRTRLAQSTHLSAAAVSFVTADLLAEHLVVEQSSVPRRGRAVPLDVNYSAHFAVGIKVMETRLEAVLTDLSLQALAETQVSYAAHTPERVAQAVAQAMQALLDGQNITREQLIGVGVGIAGTFHPQTGVCLISHRLGWRNVPIADLIAEQTGVAVWVDNDVNAFATAERLVGHGKQAANFLVIALGRGVGAGLVLNGELYRGAQGGSGEFGHSPIEADGRPCECGRRGCLEAYASEPAILAQLAETGEWPTPPSAPELLELTQQQHPAVLRILNQVGRRLGQEMAQAVNMLDPELVVIGGEGVRLGEALLTPLRQALDQGALRNDISELPVFVEPWGDDAWARGAAGLVVEQFFDIQRPAQRRERIGALARAGPT